MNYNEDRLSYSHGEIDERAVSAYVAKVMGWMCLGLLTTITTGLLTLSSVTMKTMIFGSRYGFVAIMIAQLVIVLAMSGAINKISATVATGMFLLYSALTGVTMSVLALTFELQSIILVFGLTSFIFFTMSIYGMVTKKDLTKIGTLAFFALLGIIIGGIVNMFMRSSTLDLVITCVGVIVFIILIAYDTQKIKAFYINAIQAGNDDQSDIVQKMAIFGALTLYLDFINLFLKLLRLLGKRNN